MAKRLQLRKGNTADHSTFTGALAELTVNTQTGSLLLHDGSTVGGHPVAMAAAVDTALATKLNASEKNAVNGVCPLDGDGLVPLDKLPAASTGGVSSVGVTAPLVNSGTSADVQLSIPAASAIADGYMSAADKTKLNGIADGANAYVLPVAGVSLGGVKSGTDITVDASGNVSVNDNSHAHTIANISGLQTALDGKVDDGQVLTNVPAGAVFTDTTYTDAQIKTKYENNLDTNAYTDAEKTKLAGIAAGAEVNVQSDWNAVSGDALILNKPTIPTVPTNVSAFTNDAGYLSAETNTSLALVGNVLTYTDETGTPHNFDLSVYLDDTNLARLVSGTYNAPTQELIFTRDDASTFTIDASMFFDDTNLVTSVAGKTGAVTLVKADVGLGNVDNTSDLNKPISTATQTALDGKSDTGHTHTGVYEPAFSKNTAFNKNFGTAIGTVAQGNDSRIVNGQTAYGWGDHGVAGYLLASTYTAADVLTKIKTVDGAGSGLDADTLDGIDSTQFMRNDAANTTTGSITVSNTSPQLILEDTDGLNAARVVVAGNDLYIQNGDSSAGQDIMLTGYNGVDLGGEVYVRKNSTSNVVYHAGNLSKAVIDALGIDADTLDSIQASQFLRSDVADIKTAGDLTFNDNIDIVFGTGSDSRIYFDATNTLWSLTAGDLLVKDGATTRFTFARTTGDFTATGNITAYSDIRLKENIEIIPNAVDKIMQLNGYTFDRIDNKEVGRQTGVIAQEVQSVLPEAILADDDGILNVAYGNMVGLLIEAIKELKQEIEELKVK